MARGYPGQGNPYGPLYMLAGLLTQLRCPFNAWLPQTAVSNALVAKVGCSIAILIIVNSQLWYTSYYYSGYVYYWTNVCYMQTPTSQDSANICYYSWAAAGVGLFFSLWLFFMQLCSGRSRHIPMCEVMVCVLATLWWIACGVTGTIYGQNADDFAKNPPVGYVQYANVLSAKQGYRTAVWALAWAEMGIWVLCLLLTLKDCSSQRGKPPPQAEAAAGGYPPGTYSQPVYGQAPPQYYGTYAPPPGAYPPAGYPPAPGYAPASAAAPGYPPPGATASA